MLDNTFNYNINIIYTYFNITSFALLRCGCSGRKKSSKIECSYNCIQITENCV